MNSDFMQTTPSLVQPGARIGGQLGSPRERASRLGAQDLGRRASRRRKALFQITPCIEIAKGMSAR